MGSEEKRQVKTTLSLHISPLPYLTPVLARLSFFVCSFCSSPSPSPSSSPRGWGMECALTSLPNSSSLLLLPPHAFPLLQHGSSQGLFPQATVWAGFFEETLGALVWHTQAGKYLLLYLLHRGLLQRLQWNLQHIHFFLFLQPLCSLCYVTLSLCFPSNCVFWVFLFPCLNMFSQRHHCAG